jgi:signal transduction histidine kinase
VVSVLNRVGTPVVVAALLLSALWPAGGRRPLVVAGLATVAAALLVARLTDRTRAPAAVAVVVAGVAGVVLTVVVPGSAALAFPFIAVVQAGEDWPRIRAFGFTALLAAGYLAAEFAYGRGLPIAVPAGFALAAFGGHVRAQNQRLRVQAEHERERARLAREIHDVLAHSLAALNMQLEVGEAMLARGRLAPAQDAVRRAGRLARQGLAETRQAVEMLRGDMLPLPELIGELVDDFRDDAGADIAYSVGGRPVALEPDATLALYRAAQEGLTNAHKHARGAPVRVDLRYQPAAVELTVENGPAGPVEPGEGGGYGLAGLRERVELAGGRVVAGPSGGGYRVEVTIPR